MSTNYMVSSDGCLYDTGRPNWSALPPLRECYSLSHRTIETGLQLRACLRAGQYAWPGGYQLYFVTTDGAALSFEAVRANLYEVIHAIRHNTNDGWQVVALDIAHDGEEAIYCDHTGAALNEVQS